MYTIVYTWINHIDGTSPESNGMAHGLFTTLEEAESELDKWAMHLVNETGRICELQKVSETNYTYLSADYRTKGNIIIRKIENV